ncbi:hypothetical protein HMPREF3213_02439 [Heyndrickxia coagulans]|uniref:Uncharacterized protein n=1 Tax=Heyndrickxia coagulans TaxID=1398 RepID=A0A133KJS9_HEYCO|nr:hypothetical protein HMPREF3213_02439 [Heyndrickxia coagulans]
MPVFQESARGASGSSSAANEKHTLEKNPPYVEGDSGCAAKAGSFLLAGAVCVMRPGGTSFETGEKE